MVASVILATTIPAILWVVFAPFKQISLGDVGVSVEFGIKFD
jgi:hypothetical protein